MKTELTTEQSQHLLDLGVPKEKASIWNKDKTIFKLQDFLNGEILPKEIDDEETEWWMELSIKYSAPQQKWFVAYHALNEDGVSFARHSEELIDALYQMTCWYYGEHLKSKKK